MVVFGVAEHLVEPDTFPTVWLAMSWSLVTVTPVGYGDFVPVGTGGRIIASFLLLGGLAFLTVIIAMITSGFVERRQRHSNATSEDRVLQRIEQLSAELKEVRAEVQSLRPAGDGQAQPPAREE
jgi:voltage-gated potassium channel Kch